MIDMKPKKPGSSFVKAFTSKKVKNDPVQLPEEDHPDARRDPASLTQEPPGPSLELAKAAVKARLARDPRTGTLFAESVHAAHLSDFEFLGLGVHSYISHLHRLRYFFTLLALLSVSSLVANGYGGKLDDKQVNIVTWLFTEGSLGNADHIAPAYGATELVITVLMLIFLQAALAALDRDAHRVEQNQVTPADFTVMVTGLPRDKGEADVKAALEDELVSQYMKVVVGLHQRELILLHRELSANEARRAAYRSDADELIGWRDLGHALSAAGTKRLEQLQAAEKAARAEHLRLMEKAKKAVVALGPAGPPCAGVAFVTFSDARDALELLDRREILLPSLGSTPFAVERAPEPSDVIWENLGSTDAVCRQVVGTFLMTLLSLIGAGLIGASSYLQPKATASNAEGLSADLTVMGVGTLVLLAGYLVVFITVPIVEVAFMRHTTTTGKEVSQVLKLVLFQVMATLSTIGSFVADTSGKVNRDWYITGGFMLVNGMLVDLFVITCVIQGWGLVLNLGRLVGAPSALTQYEMDVAYAGDGANMYVVDRLQLVTKFVVMCYIASAAIPLLYWVVLLVIVISIFIDETNLRTRLYPAPQSDEAVVRIILVVVMPFAVLGHIVAGSIFFAQLRAPSDGDLSFSVDSSLWADVSEMDDGLALVQRAYQFCFVFTVLFIGREWGRLAGGKSPSTTAVARRLTITATSESGAGPQPARAWVGPATRRAIAGSVWSRVEEASDQEGDAANGKSDGGNRALRLSHSDLVNLYKKAGREAELHYAPPDTSVLIESKGEEWI